jgi:hypothetical protein
MADIFVSYKRDDRDRIVPLIRLLERQGWSVWWDPELTPGDTYRDVIEREIAQADCIVVIWSKASVKSDWVRDEAEIGKARGILVPVLLEACTPPLGFAQLQAADLSSWRDNLDSAEVRDLATGIGKKLDKNFLRLPKPPPIAEEPVSRNLSMYDVARGADSRDVLLGIAIDVSGSMQTNIRNETDHATSRLQSVQQSIERMASSIADRLPTAESESPNARMFALAFGLRHGSIVDLLSLHKAVKALDLESEIERRRRRYEAEGRRAGSQYSGLFGLAKSFGLERYADAAVEAVKEEAKRKIAGEISDLLLRKTNELGRSLATAGEVARLFKEFRSDEKARSLDIEPLIYGATPMSAVASAILETFRNIPISRDKKEDRLVLIVSDGDSTDGNPTSIFEEIRSLGVTIISCFVSSHDVADPRRLHVERQKQWEAGATLMFDIASTVPADGEFAGYLRSHGWDVTPHSRLFVQSNHSIVLDEFIGVVRSYFEGPASDRGDVA